jgi:hypothetical protein
VGTTTQRDPGRFAKGDKITAEFLNAVVDALLQRVSIPGGTVTKIGQSLVLQPKSGRGGGGGFAMFAGLVTARYGPFVTVDKVHGSIGSLQRHVPNQSLTYVWCQNDGHPWLPESLDPGTLVDVVLVMAAPKGITFPNPHAADDNPDDEEEPPAQIPIRYVALGTVPEAELSLFRGADPDCFFTPFDAGCTLLSVSENSYPFYNP